jgi:ABC-type multidrug transport system permease subunit
LFTSIRGLELEPKWQNGILTYENISQSGTPVMIIFITLILSIVGIIFIIKFRFYWLFTGILVMALGSVLGAWLKFEPLMNILEFVLIVSLLLTKRFLVHNEKAAV